MEIVAAVLIDSAADRVFDYRVPPALGDRIVAGMRVKVPLRHRAATGTVMAVRPRGETGLPPEVALKDIVGLLDEEALLSPKLMELARWMADYYLAPSEHLLRAMAPPAVRPEENKGMTRRTARLKEPLDEAMINALRKRALHRRQCRASRSGRTWLDRDGRGGSGPRPVGGRGNCRQCPSLADR